MVVKNSDLQTHKKCGHETVTKKVDVATLMLLLTNAMIKCALIIDN